MTPLRGTPGSTQITAICADCGKPIPAPNGMLCVSIREADDLGEARETWDQEHVDDTGGVDLAAFATYPGPDAPWVAFHDDCKVPDDFLYEIDLDRLTTLADVAGWTAQLFEKRWLPHTNWDDVLRDLAHSAGSAI